MQTSVNVIEISRIMELTSAHEFNEELQRENNRLRDDLIAANAREDELRLQIQNLQIELTTKNQELEDLKGRLQIVDSIRSESEQTAQSALDEERFFHHQQMTKLKQELANLAEKHQKSNEEVASLKKELESAQKDAFAGKTQLENVLAKTSAAFSVNFGTIDEALAFVVARPHFEAQTSAELEKMKARVDKFKRKLKLQVGVIRESADEIKRLKAEKARLEMESTRTSKMFERELSRAEKEIDSIQRSNKRRMARMMENMKTVESITRIEPNMVVYRSPPVSVVPSKMEVDEEKQERVKDKLHNARARVSELESENKKWTKQNNELAQRIKELEAQNANLEMQRKCVEVNLNEANSQLQLLRETAQKSNEKKLWAKLKAARSRIGTDTATIEGLQKSIADMSVQIQELETKLAEEKVQATRMSLESKNQFEEKQVVVEPVAPVKEEITFRDCRVDGIPKEIEGDLVRILENQQMQASAKMKGVLQTVLSYDKRLLEDSEKAQTRARTELTCVNDSLTGFLSDVAQVVLGRQIDTKEFVDQASVRNELAGTIKATCEQAGHIDKCCQRIEALKAKNHKLTGKLQKYHRKLIESDCSSQIEKLASQIKDMRQTIANLEAQVSDLTMQRNGLQEAIEAQQKEFLEKIQVARTESLADYEAIINKLKARCSEQQATIQTISRQVSTL